MDNNAISLGVIDVWISNSSGLSPDNPLVGEKCGICEDPFKIGDNASFILRIKYSEYVNPQAIAVAVHVRCKEDVADDANGEK